MTGGSVPFDGLCDEKFLYLERAFQSNFEDGDELGAAIAVYLNGRVVVDLWGGYADAARTRPWNQDTIVNMNSVTKEVTAILLLRLVERGLVDIDTPVATYWPEFSAAGKANLTVRQAMSHQAGLPWIEPIQHGIAYDWDRMCGAISAQAPVFEIGKPCYHAFTYGHLIGEIIKRVSGLSVGAFLRDELTEAFDFDFHIGLRPEDIDRCAEFTGAHGHPNMRHLEKLDTVFSKSFAVFDSDETFNSEKWRSSELPSANGHGSARAIAKLCAALANGGSIDEFRVLDALTVQRAVSEQWWADERMGRHLRMGLGLLLNGGSREGGLDMGPNPQAFGLFGAGGHVGIADPEAKIGFCYALNAMVPARDLGPRANRLIDALYSCL